jgi:CubicO group peptidase (beta-lactamase class C family)
MTRAGLAGGTTGARSPKVRRAMIFMGAALVVAAGLAGAQENPSDTLEDGYRASMATGTGYLAKVLCSAVFIAGRDPEEVLADDLDIFDYSLIKGEVDMVRRTATASNIGPLRERFGVYSRTAVYRDGLGCTLAIGVTPDELAQQVRGIDFEPTSPLPAAAPWPEGERVVPPIGVDVAVLESALDKAFAEPKPLQKRRTRAVVVVHGGRIVAERYAEGFSRDTELVGWSMTKSVTNALVGLLVKRGLLDLDEPAKVPEWSSPNDPRRSITLDQLMRMSSGLEFIEIYDDKPDSDDAVMNYTMADTGAYAASKRLVAPPGTKWAYASGTTNIISRILRVVVDEDEYWTFPRRALFDRIGMSSAVIEPDASGTFVGSSYMYATARDWARFGLLYLHDGVWDGERILPEGWVGYSTTPTPTHTAGVSYGAQIWLNLDSPPGSGDRWLEILPEDAFVFRGYAGQFVVVVPSLDLVVVRLGHSRGAEAGDLLAFIESVVAALPQLQ